MTVDGTSGVSQRSGSVAAPAWQAELHAKRLRHALYWSRVLQVSWIAGMIALALLAVLISLEVLWILPFVEIFILWVAVCHPRVYLESADEDGIHLRTLRHASVVKWDDVLWIWAGTDKPPFGMTGTVRASWVGPFRRSYNFTTALTAKEFRNAAAARNAPYWQPFE